MCLDPADLLKSILEHPRAFLANLDKMVATYLRSELPALHFLQLRLSSQQVQHGYLPSGRRGRCVGGCQVSRLL